MNVALKSQSLHVSNRLGVSRLVGQSAWRRRRLLILCYHGISLTDEHEWNPALYMSAGMLAARLAAVRRCGCNVLALGEAIERLYQGTLPDRAVALTFDDGYFDFLRRAWPLLQEYGYPVTVYLPTLRCEHNLPIMNVLVSYMLWQRRDRSLTAPEVPGLGDVTYPLASAAQRAAVLRRITDALDPADPDPEERDVAARAVARKLGLDYDRFAAERVLTLMNPSEVADLAARGLDVQLHTHRHRTPENDERFVEEIRENRQRIEAMTGRAAVHFCYPSGVYRQSYLPLLSAERVVSATTTKPGIVDPSTNPLLLPRFVDTSTVSPAEFEAWLHGVMPLLKPTALV
jgi:peptidoglycan/xylan/chitin deacetylase (PgdA/CDA1 family)